jgi:hypothetical protein
MEPAVRQYEIQYPPITLSWWRKLATFLAVLFFMLAFRWVTEYLFHSRHESGIGVLFVPVGVAAVFACRPFQVIRGGSLILGDDFVERYTQTGRFTVKKRICRDQIKSISENWRGLRIKDRSGFRAFMAAYVFVPATMPEYQEIKAVLAQWTPIQTRG